MNQRRLFQTLAIAALAVAAAAAIGVGAYNAGVAHGIAIQPGAPYGYGWSRPWGNGFFPVFPLFFFFFFFFFVVVIRGLWWRGPWRGWAPRYDGIPPAFEEWHRRAHEERPAPTPGAGSTT